MSIAIKPKVLFPVVDEKIVDPQDHAKWEDLIFQMVSHYKARGLEGFYWEVANELDIGETGGSPYFFTAENYPHYQRTVAAILRADPQAHVGGPRTCWVEVSNSPCFVRILRQGKGSAKFRVVAYL
jgi:hypothetical protein